MAVKMKEHESSEPKKLAVHWIHIREKVFALLMENLPKPRKPGRYITRVTGPIVGKSGSVTHPDTGLQFRILLTEEPVVVVHFNDGHVVTL